MTVFLIIFGAAAGLAVLVFTVGSLMPREHTASRSLALRKNHNAVFEVITNILDQKSWRPELKSVEITSAVAGRVRYAEKSKYGVLEFEIVELHPPERFVTRIVNENLPFGGEWHYAVAASETGSLVTITERGFVRSPVFRVFAAIKGHHSTIDAYLKALARRMGEDPQLL